MYLFEGLLFSFFFLAAFPVNGGSQDVPLIITQPHVCEMFFALNEAKVALTWQVRRKGEKNGKEVLSQQNGSKKKKRKS